MRLEVHYEKNKKTKNKQINNLEKKNTTNTPDLHNMLPNNQKYKVDIERK